MKRLFELAVFIVFGISSASAQDLMRISYLDPSPIVINGKQLQKGDRFKYGEAVIEWQSDDQVMKVVDEKTKRQYLLSAKALPETKKGKLTDYFNVSRQISTRNSDHANGIEKGGFHFLGYSDIEGNHTVVPTKGMSMREMPKEIWLCFFDPENGNNRLETKDFRSFVDDIKKTDVLVRKKMREGGNTDEEDYQMLMSQYLSDEYKTIPLTKQELEIYVSLKY